MAGSSPGGIPSLHPERAGKRITDRRHDFNPLPRFPRLALLLPRAPLHSNGFRHEKEPLERRREEGGRCRSAPQAGAVGARRKQAPAQLENLEENGNCPEPSPPPLPPGTLPSSPSSRFQMRLPPSLHVLVKFEKPLHNRRWNVRMKRKSSGRDLPESKPIHSGRSRGKEVGDRDGKNPLSVSHPRNAQDVSLARPLSADRARPPYRRLVARRTFQAFRTRLRRGGNSLS